jgi:DNA-binding transcriptional LysR family regulator
VELRQLEHFLAVAAECSFTGAADLLRISQSGLSASIRSLESELGTALFVRTTRRVGLTAAGSALVPQAERTLAGAASARAAVEAVSGLTAGTVTVGSEPCPGVIHLVQDLAAFRRSHPGIEMRLLVDGSSVLMEHVAQGRADVAIVVPTGPPPASVCLQELGTEPVVVLSHPDRPFVAQGSIDLASLSGVTFADFGSHASSRTLNRRAFAGAGLDYRVELEVNDVHTLLDLIAEDLAVALVPMSIARKRPHDLAATSIVDPMPTWSVCVATGERPSPAARALQQHFHPVLAPAPAREERDESAPHDRASRD